MPTRSRPSRWQNPRAVRVASVPPAGARRICTAAAAIALLAGCGGSGSRSVTQRAPADREPAADAQQRVNAHRLADEPPPRVPWTGPQHVAVRPLSVGRDGLYGRWYTPVGGARQRPAVVVFGGSNGGLRTAPLARAFASYGYPALALAYFKAPGLPRELRRIPLESFERAIRFARRQPRVSRVVVCGASRGGEAALLLGSIYRRLVAGVIGIVPAYQVNGGWTLRGREIPYDTPIRVERIRGPILTASGGRDEVWSSSVYTEQIELRLEDHPFRYAHERLNFPAEGHSLAGVQALVWRHISAFMRRVAAR